MRRPSLDRLRASPAAPRPATTVVATCYVLDGWPIRVVVRDDACRWRVLGSQMYRLVDERSVSWERLLEIEPGLGALPPLPPGTAAYRSGPGQPWSVCRG